MPRKRSVQPAQTTPPRRVTPLFRLPQALGLRLADAAAADHITAEGLLRQIVADHFGMEARAPLRRYENDTERRRAAVERQQRYLAREKAKLA